MPNNRVNHVIRFLEGSWTAYNTMITDDRINHDTYDETITIKDAETVSITAHGVDDGKDITRNMTIHLDGDQLTLKQGDYEARGTFIHNHAHLHTKNYQGKDFDTRIRQLKNTYIYQMDVYEHGICIMSQMSHLIRK